MFIKKETKKKKQEKQALQNLNSDKFFCLNICLDAQMI